MVKILNPVYRKTMDALSFIVNIGSTRAVPKVRGHDLIMLFLEYYSYKFFIL